MTQPLAIALAQINPTVGALDANVALILDAQAKAAGADLVVTPELAISGYPPEDLVLKRAFVDSVAEGVRTLAAATAGGRPALLVGAPWRAEGRLYNAALLLADGKIAAVTLKHELPNYGVFDEKRVFSAGPIPEPMVFRGVRLGVMVCEDMWFPAVAAGLAAAGADFLIVLNSSPFETDKSAVRTRLAADRARETGLSLLYVNQVGGQDELVFNGGSFAVGAAGNVRLRLPDWQSAVQRSDWAPAGAGGWTCANGPVAPDELPLAAIYHAMVLGLRDYMAKNRFPHVLIGMSGGIDSALTAAVATDALGADQVRCVMMPSPFTSRESLDDAAAACRMLGVRLDTISIEPAMAAFDAMLRDTFSGLASDTTEENIQARARGLTLMALSNKFSGLVVSTGNKSEMSVGYATLYGDMCGGYSVLKDVYKTTVFALSRLRNGERPSDCLGPAGPVMPERIITKPPSAELKPDQKDEDSLPPYDVLDGILDCLVERDFGLSETVAEGYDPETVRRVWRMLDRAEYKRRQAPPGVKITRRAFGRDRRYPITNGYEPSP
jgi:NAD+ synthase